MKLFLPVIIRCTLTLALTYGVYMETGIWTALSLLLIFISIEGIVVIIKKERK